MAQLAAAEEAEEAARAALSQQLAAQDGLHADKAALAQRMQELQVCLCIVPVCLCFVSCVIHKQGDSRRTHTDAQRTGKTAIQPQGRSRLLFDACL